MKESDFHKASDLARIDAAIAILKDIQTTVPDGSLLKAKTRVVTGLIKMKNILQQGLQVGLENAYSMCSCKQGWRSGPGGYYKCTDCDYWSNPSREADLGRDHSYDFDEADRINEHEMWGPSGRPDLRRFL